jgi:hypothetical protein
LGIEGAKRGFDSLSDADNSFFHARTKERNPKMTAKEQLRPARRRGTARVRRAVTFHPFHRYHYWIKDLLLSWTKPVVLFHPTLKTRTYPRLDVGFMEKASAGWCRISRFGWQLPSMSLRVSDFHL